MYQGTRHFSQPQSLSERFYHIFCLQGCRHSGCVIRPSSRSIRLEVPVAAYVARLRCISLARHQRHVSLISIADPPGFTCVRSGDMVDRCSGTW